MSDSINKRVRYTRQSIVSNTFYQTPRFLTAGEFAGNKISNNARILYTLLLDRHRLSIKNDWFDNNGEVYIYFKREEMENQIGLSKVTVIKVMQELKDISLVEEKKQGYNKPNKIYLLSPIIGNDENPAPYLDPDDDYNPEITPTDNYETEYEAFTAGDINSVLPNVQELNLRTQKNYTAESIKTERPEVQILYPNNNKLINNKKNNNYVRNSEGNKIASADSGREIPYPKILEIYNSICETGGLRPIRSINGKRKTQTAARFKEYGISGFLDLFDKVSTSSFLCGGGNKGWKADFDWLIAPTNMQKVLEGKYDNDQSNIPIQQTQSYEPYQSAGFSNTPQKNTQERRDPFLERAMMAYETAERAFTTAN